MGKTTEGGVIDVRKLEQIRKRFDEYTEAGGPRYKAFLYNAHSDVGALLDMVDALRGAIPKSAHPGAEVPVLAVQFPPDYTKCPKCGGPADNGHDRCYPPNPYYCSKCN